MPKSKRTNRITRQGAQSVRPARRKACERCASSRVRCDHGRPSCTRCRLRTLNCSYVTGDPSEEQQSPLPEDVSSSGRGVGDGTLDFTEYPATTSSALLQPLQLSRSGLVIQQTRNSNDPPLGGEQLDFSNINLICPVDHERIQNRWLEGFAATADRLPKNLSPGVTFFIVTVLRSYPHMLTKANTLPPFIHEKQMRHGRLPSQLASCANVAHMFVNQVPGGEGMVRSLIEAEMGKLVEQESSLDGVSRLAALQAHLLYALMLFPGSLTEVGTIEQSTMLHLQKAASDVARDGLLCPSEQTNDRPDWESWIVAETRRRTLFAVYMFDDVVNTMNELPCILGDELGILPMTSSKILWTSKSRDVWEQEYTSTIGTSKHLLLHELWIHPADAETHRRRDRWLAGVDEYGMAIYSVASVTQLG